MSLISGKLSKNMQNFIKEVNKMKQEDADKAIKAYCDNLESLIDERIKSITVTIPMLEQYRCKVHLQHK
jgi:hypothetical protein